MLTYKRGVGWIEESGIRVNYVMYRTYKYDDYVCVLCGRVPGGHYGVANGGYFVCRGTNTEGLFRVNV